MLEGVTLVRNLTDNSQNHRQATLLKPGRQTTMTTQDLYPGHGLARHAGRLRKSKPTCAVAQKQAYKVAALQVEVLRQHAAACYRSLNTYGCPTSFQQRGCCQHALQHKLSAVIWFTHKPVSILHNSTSLCMGELQLIRD
jgi:hypothetical protein